MNNAPFASAALSSITSWAPSPLPTIDDDRPTDLPSATPTPPRKAGRPPRSPRPESSAYHHLQQHHHQPGGEAARGAGGGSGGGDSSAENAQRSAIPGGTKLPFLSSDVWLKTTRDGDDRDGDDDDRDDDGDMDESSPSAAAAAREDEFPSYSPGADSIDSMAEPWVSESPEVRADAEFAAAAAKAAVGRCTLTPPDP
jgi:hypothetical protein